MSFQTRLIDRLRNPRTRDFALYLGSTFCAKIIPFLVLPFVTGVLGPQGYGQWVLFAAFITFLSPFGGSTMLAYSYQRFYKADESELTSIVRHSVFLVTVSALVVFLISLCFLPFGTVFSLPSTIFLFLAPLILLENMRDVVQTLYRLEKKPLPFAMIEIGYNMLYALCYTGLIMGLGFGWRGFIYATLFIALLFFIICVIHLVRRYDLRFFKPDKQLLLQILNPALPLIPHLVGSSLILMIDRILIERMLSIREVGIYAIAIMVGNILKLLVVTIMKMWGPWLSEQLSDSDESRKGYIAKCTWQAAFALAITAVGVAVAGSFYVRYLFDESFHAAIGIIPWAVLAFFIQGLYQLISHNIIFTGKTHVLMKITFITGLCNIVFSIAFIHWFGLVGAIQATALSLFIQFCLVFIHIQRNMPLPFFGSSKA